MIKHRKRSPDQQFIETKLGILTRHGDWFHITAEQIEKYAPGLLEKRSLEELIDIAQAWIKSADGITLLLLMGLLFFVNPFLAGGIALVFHWLWYHYKSAFVNLLMTGLLKILNSDAMMFITALIVLSLLGITGEYAAAGVGFFFFFLLKPGLLKKLWDYMYSSNSGKSLTLNDRVLKMVIIRYGMYENVPPSQIESMEQRFIELANKRSPDKR